MTFLVKVIALSLAWKFAYCDNQRDTLYILQKLSGSDTKSVLVVTWRDKEIATGCEIVTDKELINKVLKSSDSAKIRTLSEDDMQSLIDDCTEFNFRRKKRESQIETMTTISIGDVTDDSRENRKSERRTASQKQEKGSRTGRRMNISNSSNAIETTSKVNYQKTTRKVSIRKTTEPIRRGNIEDTTRAVNATEKTRGINVTESTSAVNVVVTTMSGNGTTMATLAPTTQGYSGIPVILPGTKWCGAGDIAKDKEDLGRSQETDKCCRAHDHCNETFAPGETKFNLTNTSSFTKLSCQCDEEFWDCLHNTNSMTSNAIGNIYFNMLRRECYKKDYPLKCKTYWTPFKLTCREYERDTSKEKAYNWFPAKRYPMRII